MRKCFGLGRAESKNSLFFMSSVSPSTKRLLAPTPTMPAGCPGPFRCKKAKCKHGDACETHCDACAAQTSRSGDVRSRGPARRRIAAPRGGDLVEADGDDSGDESCDQPVQNVQQEDARICSTPPLLQLRQLCFQLGIGESFVHNAPSFSLRSATDVQSALTTDKPEAVWPRFLATSTRLVKSVLKILAPNDPNIFKHVVQRAVNRGSCTSDEATRVVADVLTMANAATSRSVERRVLLGAVSKRLTRRRIESLQGRSLYNSTFELAQTDAETLLAGGKIVVHKKTRLRFDESVVIHFLQFLLRDSNICVLSWGTKKIKLSANEAVILASLARKKLVTALLEEYFALCEREGRSKENRLGETSARKVISLVTNGQKRALSAVNYLLGELIYDNFVLVERIIELYSPVGDGRKKLLLHSRLAANFLKNQYPAHALREEGDGCCTHGVQYALGNPDAVQARKSMDCDGCKFVPFFFDELRKATEELFRHNAADVGDVDLAHVHQAISGCERKTVLWRGQCVRVANQQRALAELHERLKRECIKNEWERPREAVVVMDFKMKYLPQYYRQKSVEHFGKRGTSWHGFLVIFYTFNPITKQAEREHVYCDQILLGTNKQDGLAIAGLVETFLYQLKQTRYFAQLESVSIQSDNAAYYHSKYLILSLPYAGRAVGVRVNRYIHTETCDGKCLIDATSQWACVSWTRTSAKETMRRDHAKCLKHSLTDRSRTRSLS